MEYSYMVIYDLCALGRNYDALYAAIKSYGTWGKLTESAWVVVSSSSSVEIRDYLLYRGKRKTMMKLLDISKRFKANYVKREVIRSYQIN